jgi:hypothetical protein
MNVEEAALVLPPAVVYMQVCAPLICTMMTLGRAKEVFVLRLVLACKSTVFLLLNKIVRATNLMIQLNLSSKLFLSN